MLRWCALIVLFGCGEPPADLGLTGRYNVQVDGIIGCDNDPDLVAWMLGPLQVSGTAEAQVFDFGDAYVLTGTTSEAGAFSMIETVTVDGEPVGITCSGTAEGEEGSRALLGSAATTVRREPDSDATDDTDGATSCTITATFSALQIAG